MDKIKPDFSPPEYLRDIENRHEFDASALNFGHLFDFRETKKILERFCHANAVSCFFINPDGRPIKSLTGVLKFNDDFVLKPPEDAEATLGEKNFFSVICSGNPNVSYGVTTISVQGKILAYVAVGPVVLNNHPEGERFDVSLCDDKCGSENIPAKITQAEFSSICSNLSLIAEQMSLFAEQKMLYSSLFVKERKNEAVLRGVKERLSRSQEAARVGSVEVYLDNDVLWGSDGFFKLIGVTPDGGSFINYTAFCSLIIPEDRQRHNEVINKATASLGQLQDVFRIRRADNNEERYLLSAGKIVSGPDGKAKKIVAIIQDITERKKIGLQLENTSRLLNSTLNAIPDIIGIFDDNFHVIDTNIAGRVLFGNTADGKNTKRIRCYESSGMVQKCTNCIVEQVYQSGEPANLEVFDKRLNCWVDKRAYPVFDKGGNLTNVIEHIRDISDRKTTEEERENLISELRDKNAELERFNYTVSHDLKSPLVTITGFSSVIEAEIKDGNYEEIADFAKEIKLASQRMASFLDDLLEISRIGRLTNPSEAIDLNLMVEEVKHMLMGVLAEKSIRVCVETSLPVVMADKSRFMEVFLNLIDNAAKYIGTPENGGEIKIGSFVKDGKTVCYVKDNGIGINREAHKRIFHLFNQIDQTAKGSGVGLSIVKRIVEVHGGSIWVESEGVAGKGTAFYFTVPVAQNEGETK